MTVNRPDARGWPPVVLKEWGIRSNVWIELQRRYATLEMLSGATDAELLAIHGLGRKNLKCIDDALEELGFPERPKEKS